MLEDRFLPKCYLYLLLSQGTISKRTKYFPPSGMFLKLTLTVGNIRLKYISDVKIWTYENKLHPVYVYVCEIIDGVGGVMLWHLVTFVTFYYKFHDTTNRPIYNWTKCWAVTVVALWKGGWRVVLEYQTWGHFLDQTCEGHKKVDQM